MRVIITVLLVLCGSLLQAQNLVINPDFEDYSMLPDNQSQWDRCNNWFNPAGNVNSLYYANPDYFHSNGSGSVQLPNVPPAQIQPYSGQAIMAILTYHASATDAREYLMNQLSAPMIVGQNYEVILHVSNGDSGHGYVYGTDNLGVHFSVDQLPNQTNYTYIDRTPQAYVDSNLWINEWTELKFIIQADSAYEYLTIGNFFPDSQTDVQQIINGPAPFQGAYYFLDDIIVQPVEINSVSELQFEALTIYPNPTSELLQVNLGESYECNINVSLIDVNGRDVLNKSVEMNGEHFFEMNVAGLARGNYTLVLHSSDRYSSIKLSLQ